MADFNLFPEGYEDEILTAEDLAEKKNIGYLNGIAFSDETGDFIRDGRNRLLDSNGIESWKSWCYNCLHTERFHHLAYNTDFGINTTEAMAARTHEEAESILTREITEAILADPHGRAAYIEDIEYDWTAPDALAVKVTIRGTQDVTIDITAYITRGEV